NGALSADLAKVRKDAEALTAGRAAVAARHTSLVTALSASGIDIPDSLFNAEKPEDEKKALAAAIKTGLAKATRVELARHGIAPLAETPEADPTKKKGA